MSIHRRNFIKLASAATLTVSAGAAAADTTQIRTDLQVAMQRHIERSQINGAIPFIENKTATVQRLYPIKAHPYILEGDGFFVMCAELRDDDGNEYEVDFYLVEARRGYRVVRTEIENRVVLKEMMQAGYVKKL
ncbi:MAG: hypothetical protein AAFQ04_01765 [Pseudomonadota bacterium]